MMSMQPAAWPEPDPRIAAAIAAKYRGSGRGRWRCRSVTGWVSGWVMSSSRSCSGRGAVRAGAPSRLALVTVLQRAEDLTDRAAAEAVRTRIDWQYLLGLGLDDPGFDHTVLSEFRGRGRRGRPGAGGAGRAAGTAGRRTARSKPGEAAHRFHARGRGRRGAEPGGAGRAERAGGAGGADGRAPGLGGAAGLRHCWARRYGTPMTSWRLLAAKAKQDELAIAYARDGYALLEAVTAVPRRPGWARSSRWTCCAGCCCRTTPGSSWRRAGGDQAAGEGAGVDGLARP